MSGIGVERPLGFTSESTMSTPMERLLQLRAMPAIGGMGGDGVT
jgi:hypothetical protein